MKFGKLALAAAAMAATPLLAQDAGSDKEPLVPQEITFSAEGLGGEGANALSEAIADAQFIVVGEDHGFADAPILIAGLAAESGEAGFDIYAVETGPMSADWLVEALESGGADLLAGKLEGRPLSIPFLGMREEAEVAAMFLKQGRIWGIDQEFIGSPLIHFEILADGASDTQSELVAILLERERTAFASGNQGAVFFMAGTDEEWLALRQAFAGEDAKLARIAAMERSAAIYRHYVTGRGLDNNLDRIALIREYFLEAYHAHAEEHGSPPKVLMKLGATHAGRSTSPMATFDIGSLVEGMAAANGMDALHIAYFPMGGEQTAIRPSPDGFFIRKPVEGDKVRALLEKAGVDLTPIDASEGHFVIAMEPVKRALRNKGLQELDPMTRFVVLGFDYLITTSKGRPNTPLAEK